MGARVAQADRHWVPITPSQNFSPDQHRRRRILDVR
jgi:hypothetical protein